MFQLLRVTSWRTQNGSRDKIRTFVLNMPAPNSAHELALVGFSLLFFFFFSDLKLCTCFYWEILMGIINKQMVVKTQHSKRSLCSHWLKDLGSWMLLFGTAIPSPTTTSLAAESNHLFNFCFWVFLWFQLF